MKPQPSDDPTEKYSSLLHGLLAPIRCAHETPLQFEIDGPGIAAAAWQELVAEYPDVEHDDSAFSPRALIDGLDGVLGRQATGKAHNEPTSLVSTMGSWLQELFEALRSIDPQAIEIAGLKAEGFDHRAISEGLDIGLRLVNRIIEDIRNPPTSEPTTENHEPGMEEVVPC